MMEPLLVVGPCGGSPCPEFSEAGDIQAARGVRYLTCRHPGQEGPSSLRIVKSRDTCSHLSSVRRPSMDDGTMTEPLLDNGELPRYRRVLPLEAKLWVSSHHTSMRRPS